MILLSLIQGAYYLKNDSLFCLGNFGLTYFIANQFIKNKAACLMHATVSSFILFNCEKNIEGFNPLQKCGKKVTSTYLSGKDLDFLNKEKDNCIDAERELNTKKAAESDPEKKAKIEEEIEKVIERKRYCTEAIKKKKNENKTTNNNK